MYKKVFTTRFKVYETLRHRINKFFTLNEKNVVQAPYFVSYFSEY